MTPLNCIDWDTELSLTGQEFRDIETDTLPAGVKTWRVYVREFRYKARWMSESPNVRWTIWRHHEDVSPRLLGLAKTGEDIAATLRRCCFVEGHVIYLIQYLEEASQEAPSTQPVPSFW